MAGEIGRGYDPAFLMVDVPLPVVPDAPPGAHVPLDSTHFTVLLDRERRFAAVTGVNVDGAALRDLPRVDDWRLDDRVPPEWQAGPEVYLRNDLDRGHLVRRRDPVWGAADVAAQANADTFTYPNAAPQASGFNQSRELWLGLEDHVLAFADATGARISVFTAPVLRPTDPEYRGIRVPLAFWKVVAWTSGGALASAGFLLDQTPLLNADELARRMAVPAGTDAVPPLGPFRTFQVPVADVAAVSGVAFGDLAGADVLGAPGVRARRIRLASFDDVVL
ncbi:DNA/RNA non-specific endonuclease [Agromyces sp. SYSU T00194]|uniref:DNA/RNA non-specific endonuclease n=1 Tax=Agromyces chitinivorans TaxID=3158560 RepID=UPI003395D4DC